MIVSLIAGIIFVPALATSKNPVDYVSYINPTEDIKTFEVQYEPVIDPDNFVDTIDNPYLPLKPGNKWVYEGETEEGIERIEVVVTDDTRLIMGVTCTVVRDTVTLEGELKR